MGKGHSNLPEGTFSVLTKFRAKDTNLHQFGSSSSQHDMVLQSEGATILLDCRIILQNGTPDSQWNTGNGMFIAFFP